MMEEKPLKVENKGRYCTDYDIENGLLGLTIHDIVGRIEESQYGDRHNYHLTLVRKGVIDLIAHLLCSIMTFDHAILKHEDKDAVYKTKDTLSEIWNRVDEIYDAWEREYKEVTEKT